MLAGGDTVGGARRGSREAGEGVTPSLQGQVEVKGGLEQKNGESQWNTDPF